MSEQIDPQVGASQPDLVRWAETLAGVARTGLGFTESLYEQERFEEVLAVAAEIKVAAGWPFDAERIVSDWHDTIGRGIPGYQTPKVTIGAVVGNDAGEILLVQRADSGVWLFPTGWADIGYSPAEVAVKEVQEETGIECEVVRLISVIDALQLGFTHIPFYSLVFHCRAVGGKVVPHPLECADAGWFSRDDLPGFVAGFEQWGERAFRAIDGEPLDVQFDAPRTPPWRGHPDHPLE